MSMLLTSQACASGEVSWKKEYGEENFYHQCIATTYSENDKSLLIVGMRRRVTGLQFYDHWIWRINEAGNKIAEASLDISDSETIQGIISKDSELLIVTKTKIISLSPDLKPIYVKDLSDSNKSLSGVLRSADGNFLVVGEDAAGVFSMKLDSLGSPVWESHFKKDQQLLIVDSSTSLEGYNLLVNFGRYEDLFYSGESNVWLIQADAEGNLKKETFFPGRYGSLALLPEGFGILYDKSDSPDKRSYRIRSVDKNLNEVADTAVLNIEYELPDLPEHFTLFTRSSNFVVCGVLDEKPLILLVDTNGKETYRWGSGEEEGSHYDFLSTDIGYFIISSVYRANDKEQLNDKIRIIKLLLP